MRTVFNHDLTGPLDVRSTVESQEPNAFRWRQNFGTDANKRLVRARGFVPAYMREGCDYLQNYDMHMHDGAARPITFLYSTRATDGFYHLFAGTKERLFKLDEISGQWSEIYAGETFGADGRDTYALSLRWRAAMLNDVVVFTNGHDLPRYYNVKDGSKGTISSLQTAGVDPGGNENVPVTKAEIVIAWRGVMFMMNTEEGGARFKSRIRWCDLNNALEWRPAVADSIADWQDLDYDEEILGAVVMAGYLFVFTDKSIWRCNLAADQQLNTVVLQATKVYSEPHNRYRCLVYPMTLVTDGFNAYYLGADDFYVYNPYQPAPESPDWIHGASGIVFDKFPVDKTSILSPVSALTFIGNDPAKPLAAELHLSWPTHVPPYAIENQEIECSTDPSDVAIASPRGLGMNNHTLVLNLGAQTADYRDYGMLAYTNHVWDARREGDFFAGGGKLGGPMFLTASPVDYTIKEMNTGYSRWYWDREQNRFYQVQYQSVLRGNLPGATERETMLARVRVRAMPENEADLTPVSLRIGSAGAPYDPNDTSGWCRVVWHRLRDIPLRCRRSAAPEAMPNLKIRQRIGADLEWAAFIRGRHIYYELSIGASGAGPACNGCLGGGVTITSLEFIGRDA